MCVDANHTRFQDHHLQRLVPSWLIYHVCHYQHPNTLFGNSKNQNVPSFFAALADFLNQIGGGNVFTRALNSLIHS
jgi:hypothetical protein